MKITVCELRNEMDILEEEWQNLVNHIKSEGSDLVLLPEMPFYTWIAHTNQVDAKVWQASIEQHDRWISRLAELAPAMAVSSRPVIKGSKRLNEAFVWDKMAGYKRPKRIIFIKQEEMPRTATGKILHRVLRERYNS